MFVPDKPIQQILMFVSEARAYFRDLLDLPTNIRLGKEGLPGTNTLAYYEHL
jgi:hypothetical protein